MARFITHWLVWTVTFMPVWFLVRHLTGIESGHLLAAWLMLFTASLVCDLIADAVTGEDSPTLTIRIK